MKVPVYVYVLVAVVLLAAVLIVMPLARPSWAVSVSRTSDATPAQIWAWYTDTPNIPAWDPLVKTVTMNGPFATGTHGYTQVSNLRFAKLEATHMLTPVGRKTRIDHAVICSGLLAWMYEILYSDQIESGMNNALNRLALANYGSPTMGK